MQTYENNKQNYFFIYSLSKKIEECYVKFENKVFTDMTANLNRTRSQAGQQALNSIGNKKDGILLQPQSIVTTVGDLPTINSTVNKAPPIRTSINVISTVPMVTVEELAPIGRIIQPKKTRPSPSVKFIL